MAKDGSADTAVIIFRVTPKEYMFNFKGVNLFTINSTDYEVVANELKKTIALYDARMFIYDANGIKWHLSLCTLQLISWVYTLYMLTVKPKRYTFMSKRVQAWAIPWEAVMAACRDYLLLWESTHLLIRCGKSTLIDGLTILRENIVRHLQKYKITECGAALRDWINKPTSDRNSGIPLPGYGIINPPEGSRRDLINYPKDRTICYEIKSGGKEGERIHKFFFSRISNGSVRFLIKSNEAILKFQQTKNFQAASDIKRRRLLQPYKYMDLMEEELKNLIIIDTSDNISNTMRVDRRDKKIQKDFFSAAEYGVYAASMYIEQDYYKRKRKRNNKLMNAVFVTTCGSKPNTSSGGRRHGAKR